MIERIHLVILREVERQGTLTAAAQTLHLTQSALTHTIKKLEAQLGTPLWSKQGRTLQLTRAGQFLLRESKRLLPQLEWVDQILLEYATGERGVLRIGMECHPCYQWLLKVVHPFLLQWPGVDVDVKQQFQFGGMAALCNYEIDILVTPDPLTVNGITFTPVFDYEQVLVVHANHRLAEKRHITPGDFNKETLYTYPVEIERLDIFNEFLLPAKQRPHRHKTVESTEMMLQLVAANRGVASLPRWLASEFQRTLPIRTVRIGKSGIQKHIHLGIRNSEMEDAFTASFLRMAKATESGQELLS